MQPRRDNAQDRDVALAVWRSPSSTLSQRAMVADFLIPKRAQIAEIENVLGSQWHWGHFQIPGFDTARNIRTPDVDYYTVDYEFTEGKVSFMFGPTSKLDGLSTTVARYKIWDEPAK